MSKICDQYGCREDPLGAHDTVATRQSETIMPNVKIFVSFEFDKDGELKNNFYEQASRLSPHRIVNSSLNEAAPDEHWKTRARSAITRCDIVIVLVGQDTHNAPGVKTEVKIARQLGKPVFQVVPIRRSYNGLPDLGPPVRWRWSRINAQIDEVWTGGGRE